MNRTLVVVLNGTRARFSILEPVDFPEFEAGPNLVEQEALLNEENELLGQDLWASSKTGRNRSSGGQSHSYDDRRDNHLAEFGQRFSQKIVARMKALMESHEIRHVLIASEPQMLGVLRESMNAKLGKSVTIKELGKDLCHLSTHDLHEYLASKQLLPARQNLRVLPDS
ncbi:host attachment protein [Altericista sp. CCNU0014]|uniref:host attachment protein n=1 Tax=Altericista sp. CCNU0014 TaxID=3082949 RepID=UPI00384C3DBC